MSEEKSSLQVTDEQAASVQVTENRVTLASIEEKISRVEYINPEAAPQMTLAVVRMSNGFVVIGKSAPADPANYNEEKGKQFAYEDAVRQIWPHEGYLLSEKLAQAA